jgi:hypothetical protein
VIECGHVWRVGIHALCHERFPARTPEEASQAGDDLGTAHRSVYSCRLSAADTCLSWRTSAETHLELRVLLGVGLVIKVTRPELL